MAYVYRHIRLDKNEPFYIGIGIDSPGREYSYRRAHEKKYRNLHWNRIVSIAGYLVEIIADDITYEEAKELEKWWIDFYGRSDLGKGPLCNLTDGGDGNTGWSPTISTRKKISEKLLGRKIPKEQLERTTSKLKGRKLSDEQRSKLIGKKRSQETIDKIVKFHTGRKRSEKTKEKIRKRDNSYLKGNKHLLGKKFSDGSKKKMSDAHKKRKENGLINYKSKKILDILTGIEYSSINEASRETKNSLSNVSRDSRRQTPKRFKVVKTL